MYSFLLIVHMIIAVLLVGSILLQQGKGSQTGAAFGSGASTTVFGSQGSASFLSRTTWFLVACFFVINLILSNLTNQYTRKTEAAALNAKHASVIPSDEAAAQPPTVEQGQSDIPSE
jgi:preprotein translocase subunit SecG